MAINFTDKVAVVTGAGGGLGKAYALALAKLGAAVVVNDLGVAADGSHAGEKNADVVVKEIKAAGGKAVANYDSVEHGEKIIGAAVAAFGTVHVVINNAGILRDGSFKKATDADWDIIQAVHVRGAYSCIKAAWPHFEKQSFGRVVNISSAAGLYGNFGQANYSAAKSALLGLSKTLSIEGKKRNILVNVVAPLAASRMTETVMPPEVLKMLSPDMVAPLVLYLSSESCTEGGEIWECAAGWFSALRWQRTAGAVHAPGATVDDVAALVSQARDFDNGAATFPTSTMDSVQAAVQAFEAGASKAPAAPAAAAPAAAPAAAAPAGALKVARFFDFATALFAAKGAPMIGHVYHFDITQKKSDKKPVASWTIDLKSGTGSVTAGKPGKAGATFTMTDADAVNVMLGKLNPQMAFLQGKMKIAGDMPAATKFTPELFPKIEQADLESLEPAALIAKLYPESKM